MSICGGYRNSIGGINNANAVGNNNNAIVGANSGNNGNVGGVYNSRNSISLTNNCIFERNVSISKVVNKVIVEKNEET